MKPLYFAALIEQALTQHDIKIVQVRCTQEAGYRILEITSVRNDQILMTRIDWFLVEQSIAPAVAATGEAQRIIKYFESATLDQLSPSAVALLEASIG